MKSKFNFFKELVGKSDAVYVIIPHDFVKLTSKYNKDVDVLVRRTDGGCCIFITIRSLRANIHIYFDDIKALDGLFLFSLDDEFLDRIADQGDYDKFLEFLATLHMGQGL